MGWKITFEGTERVLSAEEIIDPYVTRWEGGKVVDLDELSPDVFDKIAADENGNDSWWGVYRFPCASGARMWEVAKAAAHHGGVDAPTKPANMIEANALMAQFERTVDIQDRPVIDGFPQEPPETETGSSSGPSNDSGGSLPQPEENPSETS
jgi:hypothetical protein